MESEQAKLLEAVAVPATGGVYTPTFIVEVCAVQPVTGLENVALIVYVPGLLFHVTVTMLVPAPASIEQPVGTAHV